MLYPLSPGGRYVIDEAFWHRTDLAHDDVVLGLIRTQAVLGQRVEARVAEIERAAKKKAPVN